MKIPFIERENRSQAYLLNSGEQEQDVLLKFECVHPAVSNLSPPGNEYMQRLLDYVPYRDGPDLKYSILLHHKTVTDKIDLVLQGQAQ